MSRGVLQQKVGICGRVLVAVLLGAGIASAADLVGTVGNGTTGRPAAGDEVVLLTPSESGMNEVARVKTNSAGRFRFAEGDVKQMYLLRVTQQGVTYHKLVGPGPTSLLVYDVAEKVGGISAVMDVQRFEATEDTLEIKQLITMRNASKPPRTLMNDRPFEIQLPPEARVESGLVQVEDAQPLKQRPSLGEQKGHYYFSYPLRPGDTRFAVVYRMPYAGKALIEPRIRNADEKFVVMLPESMKFEPNASGFFKPMAGVSQDNVQATDPLSPGQILAFRISGTGMLAELQGRRDAQKMPAKIAGGGLGPPSEMPDPLNDHRWIILSGLAAAMLMGAVFIVRRPSGSRTAEREMVPVSRQPKESTKRRKVGSDRSRKHRTTG